MKKIAIRTIFVALCLLLGHSFVTHHHHAHQEASLHLSQNTQQDFRFLLSELYALDLGSSHLEHYQIQDFSFDFLLVEYPSFLFFSQKIWANYSPLFFDIFIKSFILENKSLRSPPFYFFA